VTWPEYGPWTLAGFIALGVLTLALWGRAWWQRRRGIPGLRFPARFRVEGVARGWRARLVHVPLGLRLVSLLLLLAALFRPQLTSAETAEVEGIDIVVAFDLSGSMDAVDISDEDLVKLQNAGKEPENRFVIARRVIRDFIESRKYDRVSLVAFGKEAFLMFPLTLDYGVMLRILDRLELNDIDGSATAIGNALAMSMSRLKDSDAKTRLVILLTDGDDNGSNVSPKEMARALGEKGIHVFPILVGAEGQSWQPTNMVDFVTGHKMYKKAEYPVNPALLDDIAKTTDGQFFRASDQESLEKDFRTIIDRFEKSRVVDYAAAEKTEIFHWFLAAGLALLLLEVALSQTVLRRFP
jgi:Ca-activated chloride channel family protein